LEDTLQITAYSVYDLVDAVAKATKEGYEVSTNNEDYPQMLGIGLFVLTMRKPAPKIQDEVKEEEKVEVKPRGRVTKVQKET